MLAIAVLSLFFTVAFSERNHSKIRQVAGLWRETTCSSVSAFLSASHAQHAYGQDSFSCAADPAGGSDHVLRVHYAHGSYSGSTHLKGGGFYATPVSAHTSMMLSYDLYFSNNFDFVKGGKLPGLWGGSTTCTGGRHSDDCFTTRFMWRSGGQGEVYAYIPREQDPGFCQRADVECNFDYGNSLGRGKWHFKKGTWQNIAQYVHLNTPGQHDGYIRVFLDGHKVYEIRNVALRVKDAVNINGFVFSTFFGGSDSSWAATTDCDTYYRNFVLSTDANTPVIIG